MAQQRITRDDLEAKFRAIQDDVQGNVEDKKQTMITAAAVAGETFSLAALAAATGWSERRTLAILAGELQHRQHLLVAAVPAEARLVASADGGQGLSLVLVRPAPPATPAPQAPPS